ncbi:hypothetical protein [Streptosporangium sp. NPDC006007]|uniref:hypothetical protein n=1 Tax=Streptosporangium sp. NPDC006007 TaxID=3154575 RepID=UPI0033AE2366
MNEVFETPLFGGEITLYPGELVVDTGTPHQLDLWRIATGRRLGTGDLYEMITTVVGSILPWVS